MGDDGFIGEFNYIVRITYPKTHASLTAVMRITLLKGQRINISDLVAVSSIFRCFLWNLNVIAICVMMLDEWGY